ncbi:MAG: hypothetical protein PSV36_05180 [Algoriphagus sp.]|nr:hypothetical protein [Algoriphagus sp.]
MRLTLLILFCLICLSGFTQEIHLLDKPIAEITLKNIDLVSLDTKDQVFVSNIAGDIYLFSAEGKELNLFSPARQGRLNQLEAAWTVNIFSFSSDLQEYRVLDRFLNPLTESGFLIADIHLAKAATFGNNNVIWVWDESDLSLKSLDYLRNLVIQSQPLNLILNSENLAVSEIREFKNRVFMNVPESGIFVFDNQGNLLEKLNVKTTQRLCFYKEHLLWLEQDELMSISLSTGETQKIATIQVPDFLYLQVGQERLAIISKDKLTLYPMPDWLKNIQ